MEQKVKFDKLGRPVLTEQDAVNLLLEKKRIPRQSVVSDDADLYNKAHRDLQNKEPRDIFYQIDDDISFDEFHAKCVAQWNIPESYKSINVLEYVLAKCTTEKQQERVCLEYIEFEKRNLINLLQALIYLVDYFRENNYVWGVGRGSSTASYVLFLIGIHRIDALLYELEIDEFLR